MKHEYLTYPYASKRVCTIGRKGMVATSQPLAAQAGLEMLKKGGNAIDAAIATAACLTVVEPSSNGIGGDAFALVWTNQSLYGLNASGPAPKQLSMEALENRGIFEMPKRGFIPITVPGAPSAWAALSHRFGKLSLKEVLKPVIQYAREGYPISPTLGRNWARAVKELQNTVEGEEYEAFFQTFAPDGRAPNIGEVWRSEEFAQTLELIAETNAEALYKGELAAKIDQLSQQYDGFIRNVDLEQYQPEWVDPIKVNYIGYDIWEIPPNGQGLVALMALKILEGFHFHEKEHLDTYHFQLEAMKLAFADGEKYISDPRSMKVKIDALLSESYVAKRREFIHSVASLPESGQPQHSGTVYLATADEEGNMVSFIQSNYMDFGSAIVVPDTGILLQNRGHNFSLNRNHINALAPGKKTYHTIIPGFISQGTTPIGPFGVMGAFMQPQGHTQVLMNMIDFQMNPQAALDAPRWQWIKDYHILLEKSVPGHIMEGLVQKGHQIEVSVDSSEFGRGQIIWRDPLTGVLFGGTEPRTDGAIAVW